MSKVAKQFREELAAKAPFKVWLLLDGANVTRVEREAHVTAGCAFVAWPMSGLFLVDPSGYLKGSKNVRRWRVCAEDFAEMKRRQAILSGEVAHFLPVTGSVFPRSD